MKTFSALLVICAGNSLVSSEFPAQRPVTRSFYVVFDLRLNKRLNKQSWGWWFETLSRSLWRHCNEKSLINYMGWRASKWYIWWIPMNTGARHLRISYLQMPRVVWGNLFPHTTNTIMCVKKFCHIYDSIKKLSSNSCLFITVRLVSHHAWYESEFPGFTYN